MCELLGISAKRKIKINGLLEPFFSHSTNHRNGWGLALLDEDQFSIDKEPKMALDSLYLRSKLEHDIEASKCIAHIRRATIGDVAAGNTHPFLRKDDSGRTWILAHNGTIFESEPLRPFQYIQEGTTDSERILLYIVDAVNKRAAEKGGLLGEGDRIATIENAIKNITPGNKVNLIIYDGELFYVHKNQEKTLYMKEGGDRVICSTAPLSPEGWREFPQNRLMVYRDGRLVYAGSPHNNTYVHNEERMKLLYFAYSGL